MICPVHPFHGSQMIKNREHECCVLHLAMHGHVMTRAGRYTLDFKERGEPVEPGVLATCIAAGCARVDREEAGCVECVVITACNGAEIATHRSSELCVPYVVSWETAVDDVAALTFSEVFYGALACGANYPEAFDQATSRLQLRGWVIDADGGVPKSEDSHRKLLARQEREKKASLKAAGIPRLDQPADLTADARYAA